MAFYASMHGWVKIFVYVQNFQQKALFQRRSGLGDHVQLWALPHAEDKDEIRRTRHRSILLILSHKVHTCAGTIPLVAAVYQRIRRDQ